jgi:hypothetical protein
MTRRRAAGEPGPRPPHVVHVIRGHGEALACLREERPARARRRVNATHPWARIPRRGGNAGIRIRFRLPRWSGLSVHRTLRHAGAQRNRLPAPGELPDDGAYGGQVLVGVEMLGVVHRLHPAPVNPADRDGGHPSAVAPANVAGSASRSSSMMLRNAARYRSSSAPIRVRIGACRAPNAQNSKNNRSRRGSSDSRAISC